jgi:fucose permease
LIFAIKAGVPLGAMLAAVMLPRLAERVGWQGAIAASVSLFVVLALLLMRRQARWDDDRDPSTLLRAGALAGTTLVMRHPVLRSLAFVGFCYAAFQVCLIAFAVTMLATELGWSLVEAGSIAAVMQAAGMAGRITWSMFADRYGNGLLILVLLGGAAAAFGIMVTGMAPNWSAAAMMLAVCVRRLHHRLERHLHGRDGTRQRRARCRPGDRRRVDLQFRRCHCRPGDVRYRAGSRTGHRRKADDAAGNGCRWRQRPAQSTHCLLAARRV